MANGALADRADVLRVVRMDLRERLAELEHQQWAHWLKYMMNNATDENIEEWVRKMRTSYSDLTEAEKESDRFWADKVLELIAEAIDEGEVQ